MNNKSTHFSFTSLILFIAAFTTHSATAVQIDVDLDDVLNRFFIDNPNPNPNYSINIPQTITYTPGQDLEIWINFVDLDGSGGNGIGAKQHLEVFDLEAQVGVDPDPPQDINVFLNGDNSLGQLTGVSFGVEFTGVSGNLSTTTLQSNAPFCNAGTCSSGVMGADLIVRTTPQDDSFWYHDFHILFSSDTNTAIAPFDITEIAFGGAADNVAIGTWPIPEPPLIVLLAIGLTLLARHRYQTIKAVS